MKTRAPEAPGDLHQSPLLEQYFSLKKESPDGLLLFRVGDFYEAYGDDAKILSRALEIVLTGKESRGTRIPMAGVPHHTLESHLKTLLARGHKVAVSEQMEEPSQAKGLIRRDIVRFLTPATVLESDLLNEREPNYLAALYPSDGVCGISWCDVSTGRWFASRICRRREDLCREISRISPKEIIISKEMNPEEIGFSGARISVLDEMDEGVDISRDLPGETRAACRLLSGYLHKIFRGNPPKLFPVSFNESQNRLILDPVTVRNLELLSNLSSGGLEGSLLGLLDQTKTAMGGRQMRSWLTSPLVHVAEIEKRHSAIEELLGHGRILSAIQKSLSRMGDLERLSARAAFKTANARDLNAIGEILRELPSLKERVADLSSEFFREFVETIPDFSDLCDLLSRAIHPEPPLGVKDGGLIREGYSRELDDLKSDLTGAMAWIADLEDRERKNTGIKSLKVGFNQVFGYYLEITKSNLDSVPSRYIRKQTLANAERYIVEELKIEEAKILRGREKLKSLEYEIFCSVRDEAGKRDAALRACALLLANLDALAGLAAAAQARHYTRPTVLDGESLAIKSGRHPVVEAGGTEPFVPNDCFMDAGERRLVILTGPNMAGKSTYLRQIALIVIMAQMGSFVPAEAAQIGVVDRVFTRIGASDDLHRGESTFFVEMRETAEILNQATRKSLVLLDEIGRGTSTFDGLSLAWAAAEELLHAHAKVLFATHYHEMTALARRVSGVQNFSVAVADQGDEIVFLRRIVPGSSDKSYGIHVARLAGIPDRVTRRAKEILMELEERDLGKKIRKQNRIQLSLMNL